MMGAAKFMVTIKFAEEPYPKTYFFDDSAQANRFYYDRREFYKSDDLFNGSKVQLWKLSDDSQRWDLKLSSDNA